MGNRCIIYIAFSVFFLLSSSYIKYWPERILPERCNRMFMRDHGVATWWILDWAKYTDMVLVLLEEILFLIFLAFDRKDKVYAP